jgi:hypothetical protein
MQYPIHRSVMFHRNDEVGAHVFFGQHLCRSGDLILWRCRFRVRTHSWRIAKVLTNDERYHGGSISSCCFEALDQLLHLPDLDVLLGLIRLGVTHLGGRRRFKFAGS